MPQTKTASSNHDDSTNADTATDPRTVKPKPPTKKARKATYVGPEGLTGRRKSLSKVLNLPLDILYEILSALHPSDILSLSRTSRLFRETLRTSNACGVWRTAMDRDGAPKCPSDWTEPRWAALLYDQCCQNCLARNVRKPDVLICRTLCTKCRKQLLVSERHVRLHVWSHSNTQEIIDLTPVTLTPIGNGPRTRSFWHMDDLETTDRNLELFKTDKDALENWVEGRKKLLKELQALANDCLAWKTAKGRQRFDDEREIMEQRFLDVGARLKAHGYSEDEIEAIRWNPEVRKASTLTERSWGKIKESILAVMDANREVIRRQDLHHHYLRRSEVVEAIYDDYQAQYGTPFECRLLPSLMDLCSLPELKEQIEADADDSFSDIEDRLPALILACEERLKREAQTVLLESCQTIDLDLAISVLHCTQCAGLLFGSTEMLRQHGCRRFYPKSNNRYECPPLLLECVAQVIRSAGLDLATATIEDMDRSNVFFSCSTHPLHMIRGSRSTDFYSWRSYVNHCVFNPRSTSCQMVRAPDSASDAINGLRSFSLNNRSIWRCNHCPHKAPPRNRSECVQHLLTDHGIQDPVINVDFFDFDPSLQHNSTSYTIEGIWV